MNYFKKPMCYELFQKKCYELFQKQCVMNYFKK